MNEKDSIDKCYSKIKSHFKLMYNKDLDDLEITDVPGYWQDKDAMIHPGHPLHRCMFCQEPFKATYVYFDKPKDNKGRWASRYRTWRVIYKHEMEEIDEN